MHIVYKIHHPLVPRPMPSDFGGHQLHMCTDTPGSKTHIHKQNLKSNLKLDSK